MIEASISHYETVVHSKLNELRITAKCDTTHFKGPAGDSAPEAILRGMLGEKEPK